MNITEKGQVTIPQAIREKYRLLPNSAVDFIEEGGRVYIQSSAAQKRTQRFAEVRGTADSGLSTENILALTRSESASEKSTSYS